MDEPDPTIGGTICQVCWMPFGECECRTERTIIGIGQRQ